MRQRSPSVHLNLNVWGAGPSPTIAINARSARLKAEGHRVFRLGLGQSPFPVPELMVQALRDNAHRKEYLPVEGLPELRQAVAAYYRRQGIELSAGDVLVGPGSKELMFLLQLAYYGELVIPTPSWVSYAPQARFVGRTVTWVPTTAEDGWPLLPRELDAVCRTDAEKPRIVVLNYPSNPTGQSYGEDRLREFAEVARRYRVVLLSDEIYGELHFRGEHVSVASFYPEGTIITSGISKWCGAGGWRLGTFAFPSSLGWLRDAMSAIASETYTSTSAPIQIAAVLAFDGRPRLERYLAGARAILAALGARVTDELRRAGASVAHPHGGFYSFPDFGPRRDELRARGIQTSAELCERLLLETGVAVLPGSAFGRPDDELTFRLAYVDFDGAAALAAWERSGVTRPDASFLAHSCADVLEALVRVRRWFG